MPTVRFNDVQARAFGKPIVLQLEVERETGIVCIREKGKQKVHEVTLAALVTIAYERCITAEVAEQKKLKKKR